MRDSLTGVFKARIAGRPRTSLAYAPDRPLLAIGDNEGTVRLCDTATGKDLQVFKREGGGLSRPWRLASTANGWQRAT